MGFLDDYNKQRDERIDRETESLIDSFGGPNGCLKIIFFPITFPFYILLGIGKLLLPLIGFILNAAWKIPVILLILIISIMVLLPIKLALYIISFGQWNGFEDRFMDRISDVYDSEGFNNL